MNDYKRACKFASKFHYEYALDRQRLARDFAGLNSNIENKFKFQASIHLKAFLKIGKITEQL